MVENYLKFIQNQNLHNEEFHRQPSEDGMKNMANKLLRATMHYFWNYRVFDSNGSLYASAKFFMAAWHVLLWYVKHIGMDTLYKRLDDLLANVLIHLGFTKQRKHEEILLDIIDMTPNSYFYQ